MHEITRNLLDRTEGPDWEDANLALQQTLQDYAGRMRNQKRLEQGLFHLRRLKAKAYTSLMARNPHELFHCLETLNMFDLGELVFLGALDRKETRDLHVRPEYAFTNPLLNQAHIVQKKEGRTVLYWQPY